VGIGRAHEHGVIVPAAAEASTAMVYLTPLADRSAPITERVSQAGVGQLPPRDPKPAPPSQEDLEFRRGALGAGTPGLTPAKWINIGTPRYTAAAMRAKVQGSVEIEIVVGTDGTVERARVTRSLDREHGLDEQALEAARSSRFEPIRLNGQPVETWMRLTLDFKLY
jgi:TonB family protein